jgi:hypothetical protein
LNGPDFFVTAIATAFNPFRHVASPVAMVRARKPVESERTLARDGDASSLAAESEATGAERAVLASTVTTKAAASIASLTGIETQRQRGQAAIGAATNATEIEAARAYFTD